MGIYNFGDKALDRIVHGLYLTLQRHVPVELLLDLPLEELQVVLESTMAVFVMGQLPLQHPHLLQQLQDLNVFLLEQLGVVVLFELGGLVLDLVEGVY